MKIWLIIAVSRLYGASAHDDYEHDVHLLHPSHGADFAVPESARAPINTDPISHLTEMIEAALENGLALNGNATDADSPFSSTALEPAVTQPSVGSSESFSTIEECTQKCAEECKNLTTTDAPAYSCSRPIQHRKTWSRFIAVFCLALTSFVLMKVAWAFDSRRKRDVEDVEMDDMSDALVVEADDDAVETPASS